MKVAIYNRGKQLAVRHEPNGEIECIIESGAAFHIDSVSDGWAKLTMGGYVREDLVTIGTVIDVVECEVPGNGDAGQPEEEVADAAEPAEQPGDAEAEGQQPEDSGELANMKINELRELARNSGVKIPKSATKDKIIELLLSNE